MASHLPTSNGPSRENAPTGMKIDNSSSEGAIRKAHLTLDTFSPVNQNGSFEFDRVIKSGEVLKRNRKTKVWKPILLVLRPNSLSIYKDPPEGTQLRHQISLTDLTAVARQKDPKRKAKHVFGLFSPARNFHIEAPSEKEATEWVELIRREARIDEEEEEMILMSPSISRRADPMEQENISHVLPNRSDHPVVGSSSSDPEPAPATLSRPKGRSPYGAHTTPSTMHSAARKPSQAVHAYSGNEAGSMSDFSDTGFFPDSSLSLPKPSVSSSHPEQPSTQSTTSTAGPSAAPSSTQAADTVSNPSSPPRPTTTRHPSHHSTAPIADSERIVHHGYLYLLRTHRRLRQWKSLWCVLRPKGLALYKDEDEYKALLIIPFENIIDAVDIDPISRSKRNCFMVITEERNWKFCAMDEEGVMRWLGAVKSLVARRRAVSLGEKDREEQRGRVMSREVKGENVRPGEGSKGVEVAAATVAASVVATGDAPAKIEDQQHAASLPIR